MAGKEKVRLKQHMIKKISNHLKTEGSLQGRRRKTFLQSAVGDSWTVIQAIRGAVSF